MPNPHDKSGVPHIEVDDAADALRKTEAFGRQILAVPKKKIDARLAKEKFAKKKPR